MEEKKEKVLREEVEKLKKKMSCIDSYDIFAVPRKSKKDGVEEIKIYAAGQPLIRLKRCKKGQIYFSLYKSKELSEKSEKWKKFCEMREKNKRKPEEQLKKLLEIDKKTWNEAREYFKNKGDKTQVERKRATTIANINNSKEDGGIRIIDLEYPVSNPNLFIDLVGIRKSDSEDALILSYIEYKCKTSSMTGKYGLENHVKKMISFYESDNYENFNIDNENLSSLEIKKEVLLLLSHINDCSEPNGLSRRSAIKVLENIKNLNDEKIRDVKVCIISDEEERIEVANIIGVDDAIKQLKDK